ncbi:MAG: hypothetical protein HYX92_16665 [Chloroflexi bacterium]|nr:hypothetical protein [Chloroflexota bacterium]
MHKTWPSMAIPVYIGAALALLLASCAPAAAPAATPKPAAAPTAKPAAPTALGKAPATAETPAPKPAAPAPSPKPAADQPRYGGILTVVVFGDPPTLDLHQESDLGAHVPLGPAYNGLLQYDPLKNDKVISDLAESWDVSKDGTEYTLRLNKGVKFHDGSTLMARDVLFSLERSYNAPRGTLMPRKDIYAQVLKIEAPDDSTIKITMKAPQYAFIPQLARGENVIFSKAFTEAKGHMKGEVMGTGPFKLKRYNAGSQLELTKFPDYFVKDRPYLDGVAYYVMPDAATRFAAFRTGRVMLTAPGGSVLSASEGAAVQSQMKDKAVAQKFTTLAWHELLFNFTRGPGVDFRVRQAINLAIDRPKAVEVALEGSGRVGGLMLPGSEWAIPQEELLKMPGYRQPKDADVAEAKKLLAEAGYPNGFEVTWPVRRGREWENIAIFLKDQAAKLGINAKIELLEYSIYLDTRRQGNWDMFPISGALRISDPDEASQRLMSGGAFNYGKFSDQKYDELHKKQGSTMDVSERRKISLDLQKRVLELQPKIITAWVDRWVGYWLTVKNYVPGIGQYNNSKHANVWLAK